LSNIYRITLDILFSPLIDKYTKFIILFSNKKQPSHSLQHVVENFYTLAMSNPRIINGNMNIIHVETATDIQEALERTES